MCGIIGYIGPKDVVPILIDGLRRLEYRGYDSAGVAVVRGGLVDLRDELVAAFLDDFERLELVHVANHDLSGAPRRSNCDVDHAVHWARSVE